MSHHYKEGDYGDGIIDLRSRSLRRGVPTRKLSEWGAPISVPVWSKSARCAGCNRRWCVCGECHTPGCVNVRVVCEYAQRALVVRRNVPVDGPKKRFWQK